MGFDDGTFVGDMEDFNVGEVDGFFVGGRMGFDDGTFVGDIVGCMANKADDVFDVEEGFEGARRADGDGDLALMVTRDAGPTAMKEYSAPMVTKDLAQKVWKEPWGALVTRDPALKESAAQMAMSGSALMVLKVS
jgi:hypothetical protein